MKRFVSEMIIAAALLLAGTSVFAASAKVTYVKGKVEVNRSNEWVALKVGDEVNENETISTGFQSEARLNFNGSVMAVPALSRITLETLQASDSKDTVSLKIDTGAVRSKVTHTEGKRIEYSARTSVAVASVRGTDFAVFANGRAKVFSGAIAYYKAADFVAPSVGAVAESEEAKSDEGPAAATTPANEIVDNAPRGTMVVAAGQSSTIGKSGLASKPLVEAQKRYSQAKSAVSSAAAKEMLSAGFASAAPRDPAPLAFGDEPGGKSVKKTDATLEISVKVKEPVAETAD